MLGRSFFRKDQLEIDNVQPYLDPIQNLTFFVQNVTFPSSLFADSKYKECKGSLLKAAIKHGSKILLPWKHLVQRMNNQNIGVTELHVGFVYACSFFKFYKLALGIIQQPTLPKSLQPQRFMYYLQYSSSIYANLHMFKQAYHCLNQAIQIQSENVSISLSVLKKYIFVGRVIGKPYSKIDFFTYIEKLKMSLGSQNRQYLMKAQSLLEAFLQLLDNKPLSEKAQFMLEKQELYWVTQIGAKNHQAKYIRGLGQNNLRIKATQVNNESICTFQNIRDINRFSSIYKYDSKNGIMYFNNKNADQDKINSMITQSCKMYKEIVNYQKEPKLGKKRSGMDRMMGMMM